MMTATTPATRLLLLKSVQAGHFKHSGKYYLQNGRWHKLHADKPAPKGAPVSQHPHAAGAPVSGHPTLTQSEWDQLKLPAENVNSGTFNKQLDQLKAAADAGDVTGIVASGYGVNTYGKKLTVIANHVLDLMGSSHKVMPGQKAGEHAAVQTTPEIEQAKPEPAAAEPAASAPEPATVGPTIADLQQAGHLPKPSGLSMLTFEEGKTVAGVKAYYDKVAQQIADLAAAGDAAGLEQMKAAGLQPNSKGKVSNTWKGKTANSKTLLAFHDQALAQAKGGAAPEQGVEPAPVAEPAPAKKEPRLVVPKPQPQPAAPAAPASDKLAQIPWDSQLLPDSNTNAKSHNGKVAQIKAMAEAGDVAGLEAFKAGKNTYGQKQMKLAALALAALKESAPAQPAAPAPAAQAAEPQPDPAEAAAQQLDQFTAIANKAGYGIFQHPSKGYLAANPKTGALKTFANMPQAEAAVAKLAAEGLDAHVKGTSVPYTVSITGKAAVMQPAPASGPSQVAQPGPSEGDTKQGADGTLVFKNGRWHKQAEVLPTAAPAAPAAKALKPGEAVAIMAKVKAKTAPGNKAKLKAMAVAGDVAGLQQFIFDNPGKPVSKMVAAALINAMTGGNPPAPKPTAAPASASPAPAPAAPASPFESMDTWQQTGPQGGSNPGGRFKDESGVEWYCKFPGDDDVAKSEVLAAKLYAALGIAGQDAKLVTKNGKIGIASRWATVSKAKSPAELAKVEGVQSGFGVDAWLGNWDVVGMAYDNLQVGADGKAMRVDAGGSLTYRAQGGKKAFGTSVTEIDSLRDAKINPQAASVFGGMTTADITASVAKVLAIPDATIKNLVMQHGPGDMANRQALSDVLIARKADLAAKFPKAAKATKKRLDPNNLPVKEDRLPKAHDFENWNGQGKGLSSQPHINAANIAVEQEMIALAKTGNLTKLKAFQFHAIDKATGNATGQLIPIAQHPSKHVVQLHADLVQILDEIANPPEPLKVFQETDVATLDQLAASLPPKQFGTTVNSVKSNEKLGFWVVLGTAHGAQKFKPAKVLDYTKAAIDAGHAKYKQGTKLAKHFINKVQQSGAYNDLFRDGKLTDNEGNKLTDVAAAALDHASSQPEGTSIYRWQKMTKDMVDKILAAPDGTVFQATGPMCTSYHPTGTAGFGQHRVTIRYAKGAKAVDSFGSGAFAGEKEVTTLPNSRFVILSKQMVPDVEHGNPNGKRLELELLMLPPDLGI